MHTADIQYAHRATASGRASHTLHSHRDVREIARGMERLVLRRGLRSEAPVRMAVPAICAAPPAGLAPRAATTRECGATFDTSIAYGRHPICASRNGVRQSSPHATLPP